MIATGIERIKQREWVRFFIRVPIIPILILLGLVFAAVFAPQLAPHDPYKTSLSLSFQPPAWYEGGDLSYPLGTDLLGRGLLSRLLFGARITLTVAALGLLVSGGIGLVLGIVAGYFGGRLDTILMRVVDGAIAFPSILLALMLAVTLGPSMNTVIIAIGATLWAGFARVVRGEVLEVKRRDFVAQAKVNGCSPVRIMAVHIFPNVINTFMVLASLRTGTIIVMEATLSFLGAGIPPPTPSWGQMVATGREYIATYWWISIIPGLCIALVVLSFNLVGNWLRDRLDPKLQSI